MRATKLLSTTVLLMLTAIGCGVRARPYPYYGPLAGYEEPQHAFEKPPKLVEIERGLYVVHDHYVPVYYVDGDYWCHHKGVWYRATTWYRAWEPVHFSLVPARIVHRDGWPKVRRDEAVVHRAPTR